MFHVKHGGMAELWGRQFEKYHFSPTRYRGVSVSRETWVGMCVVLKNEGMIFDHVTSPPPVVVGVGVFSCLMFHVKLFH